MSLTVCIAPANTVGYPNGGGHMWVYLQWALALRAAGCRVIWLEGIDLDDGHDSPAARNRQRSGGGSPRNCVATLRERLAAFGLSDELSLYVMNEPAAKIPPEVAQGAMNLDAASEADLFLNLWHSTPAAVVQRFRRTAFIDTDPGLLQVWMTRGDIQVPPHDIHFTIGETVGRQDALFPDCGRRWLYTPPPVFLPAWPVQSPDAASAYTTVAHWWGGTFEYNGTVFQDAKRISFKEFADLPAHTSASLELAVCLGTAGAGCRGLLEPRGWRVREAWDVTATPEQYRTYVQRSRGEFSCAKPSTIALQTAWISDRSLCYLASGKPVIVQHTGPSRILPDAAGFFRFRTLREAADALAAAEADYERHSREARALVAEHFDAQRVVPRVLERALEGGVGGRRDRAA
ncbi:MAG TPA: hypothetical protein VKD28_14780 [Gemmatimonadales bacterium]|nr:hypothetical protein [Gemmatimonadales bacterium]